LNRLIGHKLSITSPRAQTTRNRVVGILTRPPFQAIFLDTPGLLDPRYRLQEAMLGQISESFAQSDVLMFVTDATRFVETLDDVARQWLDARRGTPRIVVINKIDKVKKPELLPMMEAVERWTGGVEIIPVSAATGENTNELFTALEGFLPDGPALYPMDAISQQPERFFVSEIIREELFALLREELPYASAVEIEAFEEKEPKIYIRALVIVERASQKGIVIGKGGAMIKEIGKRARVKIEAFLDHPVFLELAVGVRAGWSKKDAELRALGYLT
jgi:GTP-binding protein Era